MTAMRNYPLSRKLTLMNLAVSGTALVLACLSFVVYDVITFGRSQVDYAASQAELVSANTVTALMFDDPEAAMKTLAALGSMSDVDLAVIYTFDGKPFASYSREALTPVPSAPAIAPDETEIHWFQPGSLSYARRILFDERTLGSVYLRLSMQAILDRIQRYVGIALVVLGICMVPVFFASSIFARAVAKPMRHLAEVAQTISREKRYSLRAETTAGPDEVAVLIDAFNDMLAQIQQRDSALQQARDHLEQRVLERTAELKQAEQDLRTLSGRLLRLQDEERRHIARELHDSTGQVLAALSLNLAVLQADVDKMSPYAVKALNESLEIVKEMSRELRTLSHLLHPPLLDVTGLDSALRWYVQGFAERSGIQAELDLSPELGRLPKDIETAVFRVVQESLTNVHRHSQSPTARVRILRSGSAVRVQVLDEGIGIAPDDGFDRARIGIGIQGMRERVTQLGGEFEVKSGEGGTEVTAVLPVQESRSAAPAREE